MIDLALVSKRVITAMARQRQQPEAVGEMEHKAEFWVMLLSRALPLPIIFAISMYYGIKSAEWFGPNVLVPAVNTGTQTLKEVSETNRMMATTQRESAERNVKIEATLSDLTEVMKDVAAQNRQILNHLKNEKSN